MFRRLPSSLPKDPEFPADLKELGYFINDKDEVRSISDPTQEFKFFINKNDRYNEKQREAMHICLRQIVLDRLKDLGVPTLRLPLGTPPDKPHIPILASANLSQKDRVIIVFNEAVQDLGIWAYRLVSKAAPGSITHGSAVEFVKALENYQASATDPSPPGVIIANLGQLLWWRKGKQAVSFVTWDALPRKTAVHGSVRIDDVKNRVPGNENWRNHVEYIFNEVVKKMVKDDAKIDIIGLSDGGSEVLYFLNDNWQTWSSRISALALGTPLHNMSEITNTSLQSFLKSRTRAYIPNSLEANSPVPDTYYGCPTLASGEALYSECVMPAAYGMMLDFFQDVALQGDRYMNVSIEVFGD